MICVDPKSHIEVKDCQCGEIWVTAKYAAAGYWRKELETEETFKARLKGTVNERNEMYRSEFFLRTGDLGAIVRGQLYVTGRIKELIIVNGANLYPADIQEAVTAAHPSIRPGSAVAFAYDRIDTFGTAHEEVGVVWQHHQPCKPDMTGQRL